MVTLEELKGNSIALNSSFNKIRDKVRLVTENEDEVDTLLSEKILKELNEFNAKKRNEQRQFWWKKGLAHLDCEKALYAPKKKKVLNIVACPNPGPL